MIEFLLQVAQETWFVVKEAAIFLLFGFLVAGVLAVLMPLRTLLRFFGTGKVRSVLWASTLGMPLPLCSCGVVAYGFGIAATRRNARRHRLLSHCNPGDGSGFNQLELRPAGSTDDHFSPAVCYGHGDRCWHRNQLLGRQATPHRTRGRTARPPSRHRPARIAYSRAPSYP